MAKGGVNWEEGSKGGVGLFSDKTEGEAERVRDLRLYLFFRTGSFTLAANLFPPSFLFPFEPLGSFPCNL